MKKIKEYFTSGNVAVSLILFVGVALRLRQYLTGRSLWVDEAMLALNIVNRGFAGLFQPLDYDQGAPLGFLLVEKVFNLLLGRNEFALRLFPILLGLLSLWMFYLLLKRFTSGASLLIVLSLFAVNPRLIYYSSEVKQYIADVAVTIILLLLATIIFENPSRRNLGWLAISGVLALWFSHPALFVLAGIGIALVIICLQKRDYPSLGLVIGMGVLWLANIGLLYSLTLNDLSQNAYMREYWQGAFAQPDWNWFADSIQKNMDTHFAITHAAWVGMILMLAGWLVMLKKDRNFAIALAGIFSFSLFASFLRLYPSLERMVLFLTPIGLLSIGTLLEFFNRNLRVRPMLFASLILLTGGYFLYDALPRAFEQFTSPKYFEHIRPSMEFLKGAWKNGDILFVTNGAVPAFEYYAPFYGLEDVTYTSSKRDDYKNPEIIIEQLKTLEGNDRVWVLMSHVYESGNFNEKDFLLDDLNQHGEKKREFREPGTSVYLSLYDLSE